MVGDRELVVVTGASSGIGKATARRFATEGGHVALLARTESDLEDVAASVRETGGEASVFPVDLSKRDAVEAVAGEIRADLGVPDILVNSAGVGSWVSAWEAEPGDVEYNTAVTAFGAYNLARQFLPGMLERNGGHIAVVESPAAHTPIPGATPYQVARYALRGLCESLWMDLYSTDIGVTSVVPGKVNTEYFDRNENVEERIPGTAEGLRVVEPEEVADTLVSGIRANKRRVYLPRRLRWTLLAGRIAPNQVDKRTAESGWQPTAGRE
jgi:short-subunit dehydrogenase